MPLPEIPDSWFKLINLIWAIVLSILGVLGYSSLTNRQEKLEAGQTVTHQKQDENAVKIETAATTAAEVKNTLDVKEAKTDQKLEDLKKQVTAIPPAVANEVKKNK